MPINLFAGIYVRDYEAAKDWYVRVLGAEPAFYPTATEAVWELAEHRYLYIQRNPGHAGHAVQTVLVDDLDAEVDRIAGQGIDPAKREDYPGGMRKAVYRDPDGNEIGYGGAAA